MRRVAGLLAPLAVIGLTGGCGLHPMYAGGTHGVTATTLAGIRVGEIGGQNGFLMKTALEDRLGAMGVGTPRYTLMVQLDDKTEGLAINAQNEVTRERRTLRARFRLVDQQAAGITVLDATAGSDAGIDVVSSNYATLAAEQTALENLTQNLADQIVSRLALYARRTRPAG